MMDERLDPLDELGNALQRHQREADGEDQLDRPTHEARITVDPGPMSGLADRDQRVEPAVLPPTARGW